MATRTLSRTLPWSSDADFHPRSGDVPLRRLTESDGDWERYGMWVLTYSGEDDDMWSRACELFDRGELPGIGFMHHLNSDRPGRRRIVLHTTETSEHAIKSAGVNVKRRMQCPWPMFWMKNDEFELFGNGVRTLNWHTSLLTTC